MRKKIGVLCCLIMLLAACSNTKNVDEVDDILKQNGYKHECDGDSAITFTDYYETSYKAIVRDYDFSVFVIVCLDENGEWETAYTTQTDREAPYQDKFSKWLKSLGIKEQDFLDFVQAKYKTESCEPKDTE